jgi:hypothetical protein
LAFTTREFPQKVFENLTEYNSYVENRKQVMEKMRSKKEGVRVVKVDTVVRNEDILRFLEWISRYQKT